MHRETGDRDVKTHRDTGVDRRRDKDMGDTGRQREMGREVRERHRGGQTER